VYSRKAKPKFHEGPSRAPSIRFAVVGNRRTGSSHLVSLLDSHPDVACWDGEIFDSGEAFEKSGYADPRDFLREKVFTVNAEAVGFKLLWKEMNRAPNTWEWLKELDIRLVHTCRTNLLDSYISYQLAELNHAFTSWYGNHVINHFEAQFDQCLEWFEAARECDNEIRRRACEEGILRIEIEYNELCATQDRVLDFLGVSRRSLCSRLKKQRTGSQKEIITNYAELKAQFANSVSADYFED
jgi:hypothetical protein